MNREPLDDMTRWQIAIMVIRGIAYGLLAALAIFGLMYWAAN